MKDLRDRRGEIELGVDSILVRKRIRKNLGDLTPLMESMRRYGLMNPIVVTSSRHLIAGHRRLESARRLGWATIAARVVDREDEADRLEMEIDENTQRKNLSTDELAEAYIRLDRLKNPPLLKRIWLAILNFFQRIFRGHKTT